MLYGIWIFLLYLLVVGMAAGWAAWLILGKSKALSKNGKPNWGIILPLGVGGSFAAGLGASLLAGEGFALRPAGVFASIIGAVLVVWLYSLVKSRG